MQYTIQSGDTLSKIAVKYSTTVSAIQKANADLIKDVNNIKVGWVINIPSNKDYAKIGKQFDKCISDIKNLQSYKDLVKLI